MDIFDGETADMMRMRIMSSAATLGALTLLGAAAVRREAAAATAAARAVRGPASPGRRVTNS